jgi:hypothetical protein
MKRLWSIALSAEPSTGGATRGISRWTRSIQRNGRACEAEKLAYRASACSRL